MNLHYELSIYHWLFQNFEQWSQNEIDNLVAEIRIINVVQQSLQKLNSPCIDPWISNVELDSHTFDGMAFDVLYNQD